MNAIVVRERSHPNLSQYSEPASGLKKLVGETSFTKELMEGFPDIGELPIHPADRKAVILRYHGKKAAKEYVLRAVNRLVMRGIPHDQIAQLFYVSVRTVGRWKREIAERLVEEISTTDIKSLVGESMSFYREIRAQALREADNLKGTEKIAVLQIAMEAENNLHKMLKTAGVYDANKITPNATVYDSSDAASELLVTVNDILAAGFTIDVIPMNNSDREITLL